MRDGKSSTTITNAGNTTYTEGWSKESRNEGFLQGRNILDRKKTTRGHQRGGASLYAFIVVKTVTPADGDEASVVAVQAMMDAALPSANEA